MRYGVVLAIVCAVLAAPADAFALTRADRAAINRTLDAFVPSAIGRRDVAASYDLATPALRQGMTRAEWAKGDLPVYPFPVRGTRFHGWTIGTASRNTVELDLLVQSPPRSHQGATAYTIDLKRVGRRWLVDQVVPTATFAAPGNEARVKGPMDYTAGSGGSDAGESRLGAVWIAVPIAVVAAAIAAAAGFFAYSWRRDRRLARAYSRPLESGRAAAPPAE